MLLHSTLPSRHGTQAHHSYLFYCCQSACRAQATLFPRSSVSSCCSTWTHPTTIHNIDVLRPAIVLGSTVAFALGFAVIFQLVVVIWIVVLDQIIKRGPDNTLYPTNAIMVIPTTLLHSVVTLLPHTSPLLHTAHCRHPDHCTHPHHCAPSPSQCCYPSHCQFFLPLAAVFVPFAVICLFTFVSNLMVLVPPLWL